MKIDEIEKFKNDIQLLFEEISEIEKSITEYEKIQRKIIRTLRIINDRQFY